MPPPADNTYRMLLAKAFEDMEERLTPVNRYEASLERMLQRTIGELRRLQQERLAGLQPLDVELAADSESSPVAEAA